MINKKCFDSEAYFESLKDIKDENDRTVAIISIAIVDILLRMLLEEVFIKNDYDDLFNRELLFVSAKNKISYNLGLITEDVCKDIKIMNDIRNEFAHNITCKKFEEYDSVNDKIKNFSLINKYAIDYDKFKNNARLSFIRSFYIIVDQIFYFIYQVKLNWKPLDKLNEFDQKSFIKFYRDQGIDVSHTEYDIGM